MKNIVNINLTNSDLTEASELIERNKDLFKPNNDMMIVLSNDSEILVMPRKDKIILQTKASLEF
ncbi:MAG: hypothetical protein KAZ42_00875 [Proteocatella sp.]|nr:hypothetical protein [Proteocatella sp.]NCB72194.1 hypothetical protein [Clostridia bacterium]MBP7913070.1 hypothetical protein [Proteocatella sp.]MBP8654414.1 hypothetical protein [Proteocatella sp.]MBP9659335.1 hypothetical protein [Proteocatella sp.]